LLSFLLVADSWQPSLSWASDDAVRKEKKEMKKKKNDLSGF
jgi:hypothetical protein